MSHSCEPSVIIFRCEEIFIRAAASIFVNSGAEAIENAVKIARHATKRPGVLCFEDGFHGRTLLALSLTSKVSPYKAGYAPFVGDVLRVADPAREVLRAVRDRERGERRA